MKRTLILIALFIISCRLLAQSISESDLNEISNRIGNSFTQNLHPNEDSIKSFCRIGCVFIKFNVDKKGKVNNLLFSKDNPVFITTALNQVVDSFATDKPLMKMLKKAAKPVIIPFVYYYKAGCNYPEDKWSSDPDQLNKFNAAYLKIYLDLDRAAQGLRDMLRFKNGTLYAVDCILLGPITVSSGSIY